MYKKIIENLFEKLLHFYLKFTEKNYSKFTEDLPKNISKQVTFAYLDVKILVAIFLS